MFLCNHVAENVQECLIILNEMFYFKLLTKKVQ